MRLIGFRYAKAASPVGEGFVPLDDLTVVLGANDVGKSRLLALMQRRLVEPQGPNGTHAKRTGRRGSRHVVPEGILTKNSRSSSRMVPVDLLRSSEFGGETDRANVLERAGFNPKPWSTSGLKKEGIPRPGTFEEYVGQIVEHRPEPRDVWAVVLEDLRASRILALYRHPDVVSEGRAVTDPEIGWRCFWCLPPVADLAPDVRGAVEQLGLAHDALGGPVVVAPIGSMELPSMPIAIGVPRAFEDVRVALDRAVERLTVHARDALDARVEMFDFASWLPAKGKRALVECDHESGFMRVHPDVRSACAFVEQTARSLLPRFVSDRYEALLAVRPILEWTEEHRIDIVLRDRGSAETFPIADVAQGHQLWLQLVLFEAVNACDRLRITLALMLENELPHLENAYHKEREELGGEAAIDGVRVAQRAGRTAYLDALERFRVGELTPWRRTSPTSSAG